MPSEDKPIAWAAYAAENEKTSWADQVEEEETGGMDFPPSSEKVIGDIKTVIDYKLNKDDKKVKVIRKYKLEVKKTSKSVARRKLLKKFGLSKDDPSGPNKATTIISEEVMMQFMSNKEEELLQDQDDPTLSKFKHQLQYYMFFKNFKGTARDPSTEEPKKEEPEENAGAQSGAPGKYIPPSLRAGGSAAGSSMPSRGNRDEQATIRVTNLSEETKEPDLQELFKPFGPIQRIYLAKDKHTQQSKGFAFINFHNREDAAKAIKSVCGFGYDHLILNVEWAKPSTTN
uniref:Eukaryotic translation initiation factor 3 subunit G n=1 Tax=Phallusia mammillata TaxID=59560 RepID=A0A6F9DB63_9ASCI|nr:eukaryotic translation initiation factor 3 subunit G-like [Phallusia mammillata]